jgi:hypothetical protein
VQMWLALFSKSLQVVLKPPSNARSCGIGTLHDVDVRNLRRGVCNTPVPYWEDEKKFT